MKHIGEKLSVRMKVGQVHADKIHMSTIYPLTNSLLCFPHVNHIKASGVASRSVFSPGLLAEFFRM